MNPRSIVVDVLLAWGKGFPSLAETLEATSELNALQPKDRGLATELAYGVARHWSRYRFLAANLSRQRRSPEPVVEVILMVAMHQLLAMDRVPDYAVINEAVKEARRRKNAPASRFVNGILRHMQRRLEADDLFMPEGALHEQIAVWHNVPDWLAKRWLDRYGEESTRRYLAWAEDRPQPICWMPEAVAPESNAVTPPGLTPHGDLPGCFLAIDKAATLRSDLYAQGKVHFQSLSSQLAAHLAAPRPGERALDLCAAPGGKTALLAALGGGQAHLVAADVEPQRVGLLQRTLRRLRAEVGILLTDGTAPGLAQQHFDVALVDAPCSTLGALQGAPEARFHRREGDLLAYRKRQQALLTAAAGLVRPGGRLVYSVCSLEPEETTGVAGPFLAANSGWRLQAPPEGLSSLLSPVEGLPGPAHCILPWETGEEGFFVAIMQRS